MARLTDFFSPKSHWQRRLWNVGLVLGLKEALEASEAAQARALTREALDWLADRLRRNVAIDPGAGDQKQRTSLMECLKRDLAAGGANYYMLQEFGRDIEENYLSRWADHLRGTMERPGRERTSRTLASHLLDAGLSLPQLTQWLDDKRVSVAEGALKVADLFDEAAKFVQEKPKGYETLALFEIAPGRKATQPDSWISSKEASTWLKTNGFAHVKLRQRGGLLITVDARDEEGAASLVIDTLDRFAARVSVGTSTPFQLHPTIFVSGGRAMSARRPRRNVEVHALTRADKVYDLHQVSRIDSSLELLSHLEEGPPAVAVAAGWSAIEALLTGPGDRSNVAAADRLAHLVACSWPRAELTDLAWAKVAQADDPLSKQLLQAGSNRERSHLLATKLGSEDSVQFDDPSHQAAARRMTKLLSAPRAVLLDVHGHAAESFRRLYRVRNLILHGGLTNPVALDSTLRTAPPLVGAGMDRITHAHLVSSRSPLELAARAMLEIERAGGVGTPALTELLE
jgi:hypothetical protein